MMTTQVTITVYKPADRQFYYAQWRDPITGKKKTRSTGKAKKRDADRVAGEFLLQLREDRLDSNRKLLWSEFTERYEQEGTAAQAEKTAALVSTTFNAVERLIDPQHLQTMDASQISVFQRNLRDEKKAEATIKAYLTHLKAALRWAKRMQFIREVPEITMPSRAGIMKGRPITTEEFE